jgi:hypothetical protein
MSRFTLVLSSRSLSLEEKGVNWITHAVRQALFLFSLLTGTILCVFFVSLRAAHGLKTFLRVTVHKFSMPLLPARET